MFVEPASAACGLLPFFDKGNGALAKGSVMSGGEDHDVAALSAVDGLIAKEAGSEILARFLGDIRRALLAQRKSFFGLVYQLQFREVAPLFDDAASVESLDFRRWLSEAPCQEIAGNRYYRRLVAAQTLLARRAVCVLEDFARAAPEAEHFADLMYAALAFEQLADRLVSGITSSITDIDELTGLLNRTAMDRDLLSASAQARQSGIPFTLAMVDVDHFKQVNDEFGHSFGDMVLTALGERFEASLRPKDNVYRYGGEEFLILLVDTPLEMAVPILERLRYRASRSPISDGDISVRVTVSVGAAQACADDNLEEAIARADSALYCAKEGGRDRLFCDTRKVSMEV